MLKITVIPRSLRRGISNLFIIFIVLFSVLTNAEPLDKVVAVINDDVITESELKTQVENFKQQLSAQNKPIPADQDVRKKVLQHLIDVNLQLQIAKKNGVNIDSAELNETLERIAKNNKLTLTQLREAVSRQGINWKDYRETIRKEMLISRIQQKAIGSNIMVTPKQIEDFLKNEQAIDVSQRTYHIQNIVIPLPENPSQLQLKKANEKAKLLLAKIKKGEDFSRLAIAESTGEFTLEGGDLGERHLAELPEIFAQKVVNMQKDEVAGPIRAANGLQLIKLVTMKDQNEQHQVTKTHVRHILVKTDMSMTPQEAERQINNIYQQLKSGKSFALMAKQYSLDPGSAVKGGDLGWITPDEVMPQFAEAMEKLPLNTVSKPVKTNFGWHLIEVLERKKIDDSKLFRYQQVRQFLQEKKYTEAVQNWQQHVRAESYIKILDKSLA